MRAKPAHRRGQSLLVVPREFQPAAGAAARDHEPAASRRPSIGPAGQFRQGGPLCPPPGGIRQKYRAVSRGRPRKRCDKGGGVAFLDDSRRPGRLGEAAQETQAAG